MVEQREGGWNRRDFLEGAGLLALVLGIPAAAVGLSGLDPTEAPSQGQLALLREVSQLVIPRTDTPGAGEVGAGAFVALALVHGLDGTRDSAPQGLSPRRADGSLDYAAWLERELNRRANGDFLSLPPEERHATLAGLDAEAFPQGPPPEHPSPWRAIKGLILTGYYTSQAGGAEELRYQLVPGRWDPDLPLAPGDRAWSSDWTAVEFG
jgi:Gluconate 2-dehydrogenase subunit 3